MDVDESFRLRVEKVFGSLASSKPSALQSSMWSLTDDEVERREWRRGTDTSDREDTPCAASFDDFAKKDKRVSRRKLRRGLEEDPDDLNDHEDDGDEKPDRSFRGGDEESEEWEIRSSIGLDPTLDNEVILFYEIFIFIKQYLSDFTILKSKGTIITSRSSY